MASVIDVANDFLRLDENRGGEGITNLKLQKLVYYAQGFHLALFGKPLFDEAIAAWRHGPVSPELYHHAKKFQRDIIKGYLPSGLDVSEDSISLTDDERELIEEVYEVYGQFTAWRLRDMTHRESPWLKHEEDSTVITHEDMKEYFLTQIN